MFSFTTLRTVPLVMLLCVGATISRGEDPVAPEKAKDFADKTITVQMMVKSSKDMRPKGDIVFLNSEADYKDKANLGVILNKDVIEELKKKEITEPASHYKDKTIKITGKVKTKEARTYLHVDALKDIEIVEAKKE